MTERGGKATEKNKALRYAAAAVVSAAACSAAGTLFILIAGSDAAAVISLFCAAVLCLLPAFCCKAFAVFAGLKKERALLAACFIGLVLSLGVTLCYYVSHDYELSVYRYMKKTRADDYYFGGYESYAEDYGGAEDFMRQMKAAPASIVLDDMSEEKLSRLTADDLKEINGESLWDYCGFDDILGKSAEETEASMKKASEMSAYEFTFGYRGLRAKSFGYVFSHPKLLASELRTMISSPEPCTVKFTTLAVFYAGQIFAYFMIILRFEVTEDKKIIYVRKKR